MAFEVIGDRPQWQTVYEHIRDMDIGDVLTVEALTALIPHAANPRNPFWRAVQEVETQHHRSFDTVRNVGYRMVEAREHEGLARRQHRRSRAALRRGERKLRSADRSRLTPDERIRFEAMQVNISQQRDMIRRLDARTKATAESLKRHRRQTSEEVAALAASVESLKEQLARHGITEQV